MASCLDDEIFNQVEAFLVDKDILQFAAASPWMRRNVLSSSGRSPVLLCPSTGVSGLWHHFQLWEVAMYLREIAGITFLTNMMLLDARAVRTFISALHIAKEPIRTLFGAGSLHPSSLFAADFVFPMTNLAADGPFEVQSSQVFLPQWNMNICLSLSKDLVPLPENGSVYMFDISMDCVDFLNEDTYPILVRGVSAEYGFRCATDFSIMGYGSIEHEWLDRIGSGRNLKLVHALEHGRPVPFIIACAPVRASGR